MFNWLMKLLGHEEKLGDRGERLAAKFLKKKGYRILAKQYRNQVGEIDLIVLDGETILFVEVKTRTSNRAGLPVEAVNIDKQKKIIKTALTYLKRFRLLEHRVRFDVVGIILTDNTAEPEIKHYQNAFTSEEFGQMYF